MTLNILRLCGVAAALLAIGLSVGCSRDPIPAAVVPARASPDVLDVVRLARDARLAGNDSAYVRYVELADSLAPNHPALLLSIVRAYGMVGDTAGILRTLERLAPFGLAAKVTEDSAYAALWRTPRFESLAWRLAANAAPVVRSDTALLVPDPDLVPESIAHDPADGSFYLGSLSRNQVVRVTRAGTSSTFAEVGQPGRIIGIKADAPRRRLWVTTNMLDAAAPQDALGRGGWAAALHAYDLRTGRLIRRYAPADRESPHLFNDLAISPAGDVFITDTNGNAVYRIPVAADTLERFYGGSPHFHWPNGVTLSPDGSRLYVAHLQGISVWDLPSGRMRRLTHPSTVAMADVDGLYACRNELIAVQRMADFEQVTRLRLSASGDEVVAAEVLERRHPAYQQPTTGVMVGDTLYYIANSQAARLQPDGTLAPAPEPSGTVVLRLPLGAECR